MVQLVEGFKASYGKNPISVFAEENRSANGKLAEERNGQIQSYAESLYKKYEKYIGDMEEGWMKRTTAIQMENWARATKYLDENTKSTAIQSFDKFAFPIIRAVLPALATERLFNIQPMYGPTSQIFYFDYVYGTTTGAVTAGQRLFENFDPNYGDNIIENESVGTGNGSNPQSTATLGHTPVVAGTYNMTDGSQTITDDGNGNLVGDVDGGGTNTINYTSGAVSFKFAAAVTNADPIEASYMVDTEANESGIPEVDLLLTSKPVSARSKKIRFRWSFESQFALRDQFGLEAEAELLNAAGAEIGYGIDAVNVDTVKRAAIDKRLDTDFQFPKTIPNAVSRLEHYAGFPYFLIKGSNYILTVSGRAIGNKLICGENVASIIETLGSPRFASEKINPSRGIHFIGTLDNRWEIFRDVRMNADEMILLYKSDEFLRAAYVWAPWITAFTTPTTILDDFQGRKGIGSLYGQKIVNSKMFLRMKLGA